MRTGNVALSYDLTMTTVQFNSSDLSSSSWLGQPEMNAVSTSPDDCDEWRSAQHILYQVANLALLIAFFLPRSSRYYALCLRGLLCLSALVLVLWASTELCHVDVLIWYIVYLVVNLAHLAYAAYLAWPVPINSDLRDLYVKVYEPLQVSRAQFRELVKDGVIRDLPKGASYALERSTRCGEKLSVLLSGRLKVTCDGIFLHHIEPNQFVDSPEYERVQSDEVDGEERFQVSIRAVEDSQLLTWSASSLQRHIQHNSYLCTVLGTLLGKDITHKLYQVQEMLLSNPSYVQLLTSRGSAVNIRHRLNLPGVTSQPRPEIAPTLRPPPDLHPGHSPSRSPSPSPRLPRSPCLSPSHGLPSTPLHPASPALRAVTPDGLYSPSQVSIETCV